MIRLAVPVLLLFIAACQPQEESQLRPSEILGRWSVDRVYYHSGDITQSMECKLDPSCQPPDHGWIEFTQDGQYLRDYGDTSKREKGRWTYREETRYNALRLESDADDDSNWLVSFEGDTMTLKGVRQKSFWEQSQNDGWPPETSGYMVIYVRR